MKGFITAFYVEMIKALKSKMLWGTFIFFGFIAVMLGFLMLAAKHPEITGKSEVLSMKASMISNPNWATFFWLLLQMVLTVGSIGPAIVTIWVFGREYSDRTIKDLLALPVSRMNIVLAKFSIVFIWSLFLLFLLYGLGIVSGLIIHLDGWTRDLFIQKSQAYLLSAILTIVLFPVITLITCISRGYLLPVGLSVLILISTQFVFLGMPGITPYFPWAVPGLCSGVAGPFSPKPEVISYIILGITSISGVVGTAIWWQHADQH
ncbi:MAG: ABC transporter permease [Bacteroidales bacterium]|jgi:ABC-2 type transport system permease protein|nr:ABC transporter permease [Bacteroidales bacterium]